MNNNAVVRQFCLVFFFVLATLVSGCASSSHSDPSRYNLQFQAHPQINESAPLKVRVLLLKSDADFMSSDFYSLQNNASAYAWRESAEQRCVLPDAGTAVKNPQRAKLAGGSLHRRDGGVSGAGWQKMARFTPSARAWRKSYLPVLEMVRR